MNSHIICRSNFKLEAADLFIKNLGQLMDPENGSAFFKKGLSTTPQSFMEYDLSGLVYSIYIQQQEKETGLAPLPSQYRRAYLRNVHYNQILLDEAQRIFKAAKGLKVAAIQGIAHLLQTYEDSGARSLRDMDFLVAREDMTPFVELLEKMGYAAVQDEAYFSYDYDGHVELRGQVGGRSILLDVSSYTQLPVNLMTDTIRCRLADMMHQAHQTASGIVVLRQEHLALLTLLNLERKEYTAIKGWLDFVVMTRNPQSIMDWRHFTSMIRNPGARRIIKRQLAFCRDHFSADIPRAVTESLSVPTGFADNGWLSFLMNPVVIVNRKGRAINDTSRRPSFKSLLIGLTSRMIAFDFPDRERKWLRLAFEDSALLVDYLYPAGSTIGKRLVRYMINPFIIMIGYGLGLGAYFCGGFYFQHRYGGKGRLLQPVAHTKPSDRPKQCGGI